MLTCHTPSRTATFCSRVRREHHVAVSTADSGNKSLGAVHSGWLRLLRTTVSARPRGPGHTKASGPGSGRPYALASLSGDSETNRPEQTQSAGPQEHEEQHYFSTCWVPLWARPWRHRSRANRTRRRNAARGTSACSAALAVLAPLCCNPPARRSALGLRSVSQGAPARRSA